MRPDLSADSTRRGDGPFFGYANPMKTQPLGRSDVAVTRLCYGCMRYLGTWDPAEVDAERLAHAAACLDAAYDAGYRFLDTADLYCRGQSERALGDWLDANRSLRDELVISTKCGVVPKDTPPGTVGRYDLSGGYIKENARASLGRLRCGTIDLYHLHRPDLLMDVRDAAAALRELVDEGTIRQAAVSNFKPSLVAAFAAACGEAGVPLVAHQIELHFKDVWRFTDGTLDQCQELGLTPLAWSPLAGGKLAGQQPRSTRDRDDHRESAEESANRELRRIAKAHDVEPSTVALAALMRHPTGVIPIVGSANPDHIHAAAAADDLEIGREDWYALFVAAQGKAMP